MKEKEGWCIAVFEVFTLVEQRIKDLNVKLTEANKEKKSTEAALAEAERQVEDQRKKLHEAND